MLPIGKQTLVDDATMSGNDLEDNILIAAAAKSSLDAIVTRNPTDFAHSTIPVWEPAALLQRLASGSAPTSGSGPP